MLLKTMVEFRLCHMTAAGTELEQDSGAFVLNAKVQAAPLTLTIEQSTLHCSYCKA